METKQKKDTSHECYGHNCSTRVPRSQLLCRTCWRLVPGPLQRKLYAAYNRGRGAGSPEHLQAMQECIEAVNP